MDGELTLMVILAVAVLLVALLVVVVVRSGPAKVEGDLRAPFRFRASFRKGREDPVAPPDGLARVDKTTTKGEILAKGRSASVTRAKAKGDVRAIAKGGGDPKA